MEARKLQVLARKRKQASKIQNPGRNDAKYRLSSVRIPVFWHVESDMCMMEVKKEATNYPIVLVVLRI